MAEMIKWKRGQFFTFYAQMKIRVGGLNGQPDIEIAAGDEFEYDGSICKYAGAEYPQQGLRGAVREGWATTEEDAGIPEGRTAARNVAEAQSVNRDLSRVQRRSAAQPIEQDSLDEETVLEIGDREAAMDPVTRKGHLTARDNRGRQLRSARGMEIEQSDLDEQDHTPISPIKSPAKIKVDVTANPNAARDIEMRSVDQGYGRYAGKKPGRSNVIVREGVEIRTDVRGDSAIGGEETGTVVSPVRNVSQRKAKMDKENNKKPVKKASKKNQGMSPKLQKAVELYADFPRDWNFFGKTEEKIAKLKEISPDAELLNALYASESKSTKEALKKAYPKHSFS